LETIPRLVRKRASASARSGDWAGSAVEEGEQVACAALGCRVAQVVRHPLVGQQLRARDEVAHALVLVVRADGLVAGRDDQSRAGDSRHLGLPVAARHVGDEAGDPGRVVAARLAAEPIHEAGVCAGREAIGDGGAHKSLQPHTRDLGGPLPSLAVPQAGRGGVERERLDPPRVLDGEALADIAARRVPAKVHARHADGVEQPPYVVAEPLDRNGFGLGRHLGRAVAPQLQGDSGELARQDGDPGVPTAVGAHGRMQQQDRRPRGLPRVGEVVHAPSEADAVAGGVEIHGRSGDHFGYPNFSRWNARISATHLSGSMSATLWGMCGYSTMRTSFTLRAKAS